MNKKILLIQRKKKLNKNSLIITSPRKIITAHSRSSDINGNVKNINFVCY